MSLAHQELHELIDVCVTLRLCQTNNPGPKQNLAMQNCADAMRKRMKTHMVRLLCKTYAKHKDVKRKTDELETRLHNLVVNKEHEKARSLLSV